MLADGATGARDLGAKEFGWRAYWSALVAWVLHTTSSLITAAWYVHDKVCVTGCYDSGKKMCNLEASCILAYQLWVDGYRVEPIPWLVSTFFGAKDSQTMKNGMFRVKDGG